MKKTRMFLKTAAAMLAIMVAAVANGSAAEANASAAGLAMEATGAIASVADLAVSASAAGVAASVADSAASVAGAAVSAAGARNVIKDENIYVSLDSDGSFKNAYVINSFKLDGPATIVDYGDYDEVRNLSAADKLEFSGGKVVAGVPGGYFYYQGNMNRLELPWKVAVEYFLGGKKASAEELAGADGFLEIRIAIRRNPAAGSVFADHYAVQTTIALDNALCGDIEAKGATTANAGGKKTATWTLLPGNEAEYVLTANVKNFGMDGIQISAVPFSTGLDLPEADKLIEGLPQLADGIGKVDEGASRLADGTGEIRLGAGKLEKGVRDSKAGIKSITAGLEELSARGGGLVSGLAEISGGLAAVAGGLEEFTMASGGLAELASASTGIKNGMDGLASGLSEIKKGFGLYNNLLEQNGINADAILRSNEDMAAALDGQTAALKKQMASLPPGSAEAATLKSQIGMFEQITGLLRANIGVIKADRDFIRQLEAGIENAAEGSSRLNMEYAAFDRGIREIPTKLGSLPGKITELGKALEMLNSGCGRLREGLAAYTDAVSQLAGGGKKLDEGFAKIVEGFGSLRGGIAELDEGVRELAEGTGRLKKETGGLNEKIDELAGNLLKLAEEDEFKPVSFISPKNGSIEAVQFVMQTGAIREKAAEPAKEDNKEKKEKKTFLERLAALFTGIKLF